MGDDVWNAVRNLVIIDSGIGLSPTLRQIITLLTHLRGTYSLPTDVHLLSTAPLGINAMEFELNMSLIQH